MEKKQKKIIGIIIAIIVVCVGAFTTISLLKNKKNKGKEALNQSQQIKQIPKEVSVRYAFADVDFDQIIQDIDTKDDDSKADYIFVRFSGAVVPKKVKNSVMDINNYKLDGKNLPKESKIFIDKQLGNTQLVIELPNKTLKEKNAGHILEINKDININDTTKITGELKLNLPYSTKTTVGSVKDSNNTKASNESKKSSDSKNIVNKNGTKEEAKTKETKVENKDMPKYSVEIGKGIPFTTIVLVKMEVKDPSQYNVFVDNEKLNLRTNKAGKKVFVKAIKKDYSYDDVKQRVKIKKIK
ncbi:hypothetical protein FDJ70_06465 [Clostridium botulinum]|uniref:Conserved membrane-associated protein n=1 Tax=Clostridium botulinum D str. 1873 TaxID=592027 RepID=A0A9P2G625_CLOBO|nr:MULTISPECIES: hypothetical protein [Clostridium]AYF53416.1 hypothetical protein DFH04_01000 [Clostridium novyi]EES90645.1 conserved membrane-associated protein [Clostridium botulinum D str. 1873]MBO3442500.1 hypothetical protein [Clostridium haemolyticum]NFV47315.1 hypothetical protein [Clostridium botulinum]QPW55874.1 hypothetical protein IRP61_02345 [Clostridium botulinum]